MTYRDKILKTNECDRLIHLNEEFKHGDYYCVKEFLTDNYIYDENKYRCSFTADDKQCEECIQKLLNTTI